MFRLKQNWLRYVLCAAIGLSFGISLYYFYPIHWQGNALVRIGQISKIQNTNITKNSNIQDNDSAIETMMTVLDRLKSQAFLLDLAKKKNRDDFVPLLMSDQKSNLFIKPTRESDSFTISITGISESLVEDAISAVVDELIHKHNAIIEAYKKDIQADIHKLSVDKDSISERINDQFNILNTLKCSESTGKGLAAGLSIMKLQKELDYKIEKLFQYKEMISSTNIRPTSLIESVSVTEKRMFTSLWRSSLFGLLLGIFACILWVKLKK